MNRLAVVLILVVGCAQLGCLRDSSPLELSVVMPTASRSNPTEPITWSSFRGGANQAVSRSESGPVNWSTTSGVRWRVQVPGRGNSSPVVWGDQVFLTSSNDEEELLLVCIDRQAGRIRWQQTIGHAAGATHGKNGFASATPAVDGQRVFVACGELGLVCYSLDGQRLWHTPWGKAHHPWGFASSPVLYERLVIQLCDSQRESFLVALDRQTGETVWRAPRSSEGSWTTPIVIRTMTQDGSRDELVVNGTGSSDGSHGVVISYDPQTGNEWWRVRGTSGIPCPTLVATEQLVISATGSNGPILAIQPGGQGDVTETHVRWKHARGGPYVPTGIVVGTRYFSVSDDGIATCREVVQGQLIWQARLGGTYSASLTAAGKQIYAVSEKGDVHVFAAADQWKRLAINSMGESPCLSTPAWADGEMLLRTSQHLYCVQGEHRATLVRASTDQQPDAGELVGETQSSSPFAGPVHDDAASP